MCKRRTSKKNRSYLHTTTLLMMVVLIFYCVAELLAAYYQCCSNSTFISSLLIMFFFHNTMDSDRYVSVQYDDISFSPVLVAHLAWHRLRNHGTSRTSLKEIAAKRIFFGEVFSVLCRCYYLAIRIYGLKHN